MTEFVCKLEVCLHRLVFRVAVRMTYSVYVNDRTTPSHLRSSGMLCATFRMTLIRLRMTHLRLCLLPLPRYFSLVWWYSPSLSGLALMPGLASTRYEFRSILFDVCSPSIGCILRQPPLAQPQSETSSYPDCGRPASIHQTGASSTSDRPSGSSPPYITFLPRRWHAGGHHSYDFHNPQDIHFYSPARCPIGGSGFGGVDDIGFI